MYDKAKSIINKTGGKYKLPQIKKIFILVKLKL